MSESFVFIFRVVQSRRLRQGQICPHSMTLFPRWTMISMCLCMCASVALVGAGAGTGGGSHSLPLSVPLPLPSSLTPRRKNLIAVVHPGPGKTGTTHFQTFLVKSEKALLTKGVAIWPDLNPSFKKCKADHLLKESAEISKSRAKQLAFYYMYYEKCRGMQEAMREFIRESAKRGRHVVLSSESLLAGNSGGIINILDMLVAEGYQLYGLITYRFYLSWFISRYGEHIKTHSITSKDHIPHSQLDAPLLSDYFKSHWDIFLNPHPIDIFNDTLSKYPRFQLRIVDLYGMIAANYDFERYVLCDVLGVECVSSSSIFEKMNRISAHESESEQTIHSRQRVFVFYKYAQLVNCTMKLSEKHSNGRIFLKSIMSSWNSSTCSLRSVNISSYARHSLELDLNFRIRYGSSFAFGNASANARKITPLPVHMEVDPSVAMRRGSSCQTTLRQYMTESRRKGLCHKKRELFI